MSNQTHELAKQVINAAFAHRLDNYDNRESVKICLDSARHCYDQGNYSGAIERGMKCIAYSVGVFHLDYKRLDEMRKEIK